MTSVRISLRLSIDCPRECVGFYSPVIGIKQWGQQEDRGDTTNYFLNVSHFIFAQRAA